MDSPFSLQAWKEKESLNFTLLSDFNREVVKAYGVQYETLMGFQGVAKRSAFVIDKEGKTQYQEVLENARDLPDFDQINATAACWRSTGSTRAGSPVPAAMAASRGATCSPPSKPPQPRDQ